jgi:DNA-directed RNA polymerase subunit RPC12/RpoP
MISSSIKKKIIDHKIIIDQEDNNKLVAYNKDEVIKKLREELEMKNNKIKQLENKMSKISSYGYDFNYKLSSCLSLYSSISKSMTELFNKNNENIFPDGGIYGSFVRQMLEMPFAIENLFEKGGYGKCFGHDVDMCMFKNNFSRSRIGNSISNTFKEVMSNYNQFIKLNKLMDYKFPRLYFGDNINNQENDYELIQINDVTVTKIEIQDSAGIKSLYNIPHYLLLLENKKGDQFEVDLLAWHPNGLVDFNCNTVILTNKGIETKQHFFDIINDIKNKEARCLMDLETIQKTLNRALLKDIAYFLGNRLKILKYGYENITSVYNVLDFEIEKEEPCFITNIEPPYLSVKLICGHKLSYKSYENIIKIAETKLKCPYCRGDLLLKFKKAEPNRIKIVLPNYGDGKSHKIVRKIQDIDISQELYCLEEVEIKEEEEEISFEELMRRNNAIVIGENNLRNIRILQRNRIS